MTPEQIAKLQHYLADKAALEKEIEDLNRILGNNTSYVQVSFTRKDEANPIATFYGIPREIVSALKQMRANKVKYLETVQQAIDEL